MLIIWFGLVWSAGQYLEWDEAVITSVATKQQIPDYRAYPDFFVGPIGLFEIWRSAIIIITKLDGGGPVDNRSSTKLAPPLCPIFSKDNFLIFKFLYIFFFHKKNMF